MYRIITGFALASALVATSIGSAGAQSYQGRATWGQSLPGGSYQQSCRRAHIDDGVLTATCTNDNGNWVGSSLQVSRCRPWTDIGNINGQLRCVGGAGSQNYQGNYQPRGMWGLSLPSGSYQQSCRRARLDDGVLTATCTNDNGNWVRSSLQVSRCRPWTDVGNINGRLRCVRNR